MMNMLTHTHCRKLLYHRLRRLALALSLLALPLAGCGVLGGSDTDEHTGHAGHEAVTVGFINGIDEWEPMLDGVVAGLAEIGYVEGDLLTVRYSGPIGFEQATLDREVQAMIDARVDLIVTVGTPITLTAQAATSDIPIVFVGVADPLIAGLVESLREPGGNITGVRVGGESVPRLMWLTQVLPDARRIYAPYNPSDIAVSSAVPHLMAAADELGLEMVFAEATTPADMAAAAANPPADVDAIYIMLDTLATEHLTDFAAGAAERGIPIVSPASLKADDVALFVYSFDPHALGVQAARLADAILDGNDPGQLPVEDAGLYLTVNLPVAESLGFEFTDMVLRQADTIHRSSS